MNPIILALDTATDACSVALRTPAQNFNRFVVEPQAHSKLLLGMVDEVCQEAQIKLHDVQAFAFGSGPGSFTGVRIAASVVQGLALGVNKPVIPISSLQALAQQAANKVVSAYILPLIDARMHEVYWGVYAVRQDGLVDCQIPDSLQKPENLHVDPNVAYLAVGTGATAYTEVLAHANPQLQFDLTVQYPRAEEVLQLAIEQYNIGAARPVHAAIPTYVRNDVAQKDKKNPDLGSRD